MLSPELLRRYPFFGQLTEAQLKDIAMIAEEINLAKGAEIYQEGSKADRLYLLMQGSVDLYFTAEAEGDKDFTKEFLVGEINPGDIFGVSALIDPYKHTATAKADQNIQIISIDAVAFRSLLGQDIKISSVIMHQVAKECAERLRLTRIQLAAERA